MAHSDAPGFRCARHPHRHANTVCLRCGDYVCADCYEIGPNGGESCLRCMARMPTMAPIAKRFWANALDVGALVVVSGVALGSLDAAGVDPQHLDYLLAALPILALCLVQLSLVSRSGQSVGKKLLGIRTLRSDGCHVAAWRVLILRNLLPLVLTFTLPGIFRIIDAAFIFGDAQRCVHDYMADTIVVKAGPPTP